jgi:hypothetical protein
MEGHKLSSINFSTLNKLRYPYQSIKRLIATSRHAIKGEN